VMQAKDKAIVPNIARILVKYVSFPVINYLEFCLGFLLVVVFF
jgi:hypothetical protein